VVLLQWHKEAIFIRNRKIVMFAIILILATLSGCNNQLKNDMGVQNVYNSGLLSDENGKYSIFAAGFNISFETFAEEGINTNKIAFIRNDSHEVQPILDFNKEPAFAVFNTKEVVFQTYSLDELVKFLHEELE
jgi:outer membrane lipopolysaccharide assembly protein LptE/RlpB